MAGVLRTNEENDKARFSDMFMGEEHDDCKYIDIAKVQMFFFTVVLVLSYAGMLLRHDWPAAGTANFPAFSTSMVTLLGISHAGYLTVKAAPKTPAQ